MFARIPQKLSAPFGLLGDEAKLQFRSQPGGIAKLASVRNIAESDSYWDQYITLFDTVSDVFSLISPHDIRRALVEAPENVATLIRVVTTRLFNLVSDHTFPSPPQNAVTTMTSFASTFIKSGPDRNPTKEVLNCVRVLQRVLPVVFELDSELTIFEREVLWKRETVEGQDEAEQVEQTPQFVIEDDDDDGAPATAVPSNSISAAPKQPKTHPALAERLLSCLSDLLFCCGFTLPTKIQVDHYKINYTIWEKGVGSTTDHGPNHIYDGNKTEVLRLLLILMSRQIYTSPSALFTHPSLYTLYLVQRTPRRNILTILCSLLNTAMNSVLPNPNVIGNVAGRLPYNHLVFKGEDHRVSLVTMCFQVLCALLDFQSGTARDNCSTQDDTPVFTPAMKTNAFRHFLAKVHRPSDFDFIISGILGILEQEMITINNLLPGARKSINYLPETVVFFWKFVELNKKFRTYLLEQEKSMDIIAYLLCYFLEIKDKPQQHGLCRAISYLIQTLSAENSFGLKMSFPIRPSHLPAKWNVGGAAADFMINAIYYIVATTSGTLNSIYPALIIALSNSAPYYRELTLNSTTRLLQLFSSFSNPVFLLADEGNPRLLFFMLESFNAVIFHHLPENPNLIYAILRSHKTFENLGNFNLARGLREVRRIQQAKEEQATRTRGNKGKDRASTEEQAPHEEKQRLLEREGSTLGLHINTASIESLPEVRNESRVTSPEQSNAASTEQLATIQPLMTPGTEMPTSGTFPPLSEKARGKMKERRSKSWDTDDGLDMAATAANVGRNGFVPTQEWVTSWQHGLPLDAVMITITELLPKVQELQSQSSAASTKSIMDLLSRANLSHVLPTPPPLNPRRFVWSDPSVVWLSSLIWGEIYVRGTSPLGLWNGTNVRLFYVKHTQNQSRQITEAVSSVVGGLLGRAVPESPITRRAPPSRG